MSTVQCRVEIKVNLFPSAQNLKWWCRIQMDQHLITEVQLYPALYLKYGESQYKNSSPASNESWNTLYSRRAKIHRPWIQRRTGNEKRGDNTCPKWLGESKRLKRSDEMLRKIRRPKDLSLRPELQPSNSHAPSARSNLQIKIRLEIIIHLNTQKKSLLCNLSNCGLAVWRLKMS